MDFRRRFAADSPEIGALPDFTSYREVKASNPERSGSVGPTEGPAGGLVLGQSIGNRWGGEFRRVDLGNDVRIESNDTSMDLKAESHAVHYDVLSYLAGQEARGQNSDAAPTPSGQ